MEMLFDAPWWLYLAPGLIGLVMLVYGLRRGDRTLRNAGLVLLVVAVAVYGTSMAVETDTEKVSRQSRELVTAVEKNQWDQLSALLEPDAAVTLLGMGQIYDSREKIIEACKSRVAGSGVTSLALTSLEPKREGAAQISTEVQIYVTSNDAGGRPVPTTWRLVWQRGNAGQWLVRDIEAIQLGNVRASDAKPWFPNAR